ncbi:bacteriohemerythrin [Azospirillum sp.]|uniref:bacteriohemerythrin n=1 Tax=Azospirillum sp. TaxID=34012 RepID=UPI003D73AEA8
MKDSSARLQWCESFCTGITAVDEQHQTVLLLYNDVLRALERRASPYMVAETIDSLVYFLRRHFAWEERLMADSGFERLAEHAAGHARFDTVARAFYSYLGLGDGGESFARFARTWILEHFTADREIAAAE